MTIQIQMVECRNATYCHLGFELRHLLWYINDHPGVNSILLPTLYKPGLLRLTSLIPQRRDVEENGIDAIFLHTCPSLTILGATATL
jgi:hypothetical protein